MARLRRIKGQAEGLERAIEAGAACSVLLQQIAALRGAAGGLMAEVLESHLRDTFGPPPVSDSAATATPAFTVPPAEEMDELVRILRTYLK
nr:metal/formaldehyde-sensitive transcriptional repressor [Ancylobacter crimeensis]